MKFRSGSLVRLFFVYVVLASASIAKAEEPSFLGCQALGCIGKFGSIYALASGEVKIAIPDGVDTSPLTCTLSSNKYFTLKRSHLSFSEIYSMTLAAQASGKNIYLRAVDGSSDCEVYYSVIYP